jgi:hypothetical protein
MLEPEETLGHLIQLPYSNKEEKTQGKDVTSLRSHIKLWSALALVYPAWFSFCHAMYLFSEIPIYSFFRTILEGLIIPTTRVRKLRAGEILIFYWASG